MRTVRRRSATRAKLSHFCLMLYGMSRKLQVRFVEGLLEDLFPTTGLCWMRIDEDRAGSALNESGVAPPVL